MTSNKRHIRGFTLIEILVALVILGLSLGVVMQIFSAGLQRAGRTEARAVAVQLAESKLATVGIEEPLTEGETSGQFDDRFRWRVLVRSHRPAGGELDGEEPEGGNPGGKNGAKVLVDAYAINIRVSWGDAAGRDEMVSLSTIRLVNAE